MFLYEITNKITGMGYVGITKGRVKHRWWSHKKDLKTGSHGNHWLQNAYNKYGPDAFEYKIRETFNSLEDLENAEIRVLEQEKDRLYNIKKGGYSAPFVKHNQETRLKIGKSSKVAIIGMSIETGEIREYECAKDAVLDGFNNKNIGKCCHISTSMASGRVQQAISTGGWVWMHRSEYDIDEMKRRGELAKSRGNNNRSRAIIGKSLVDGIVVNFESCVAAAESFGVHLTHVRGACLWERVKSAAQHVWVFADELEPTILLEKRFAYAMDTFNGSKVIGPRSRRSTLKK